MTRTISSRRRVKPNARGEQSRETILDVAERHFGDWGYRGASIAAIAEDAGISDPGLLHHYRSKGGLLKALLDQRFSVDEVKLLEGETVPTARLLALVKDIIRENVGRRTGVKLLMVLLTEGISTEHPAHDYFQRRYAHVREIFARHVRTGQAEGEIRTDIPSEQLATLLVAAMDGLQLQWLLDERVDMTAAIETFAAILGRGIADPAG